ncbi:MAG: hypothetical protein WA060_02220 [Minisyncoccia bacterium]
MEYFSVLSDALLVMFDRFSFLVGVTGIGQMTLQRAPRELDRPLDEPSLLFLSHASPFYLYIVILFRNTISEV